MTKFLVVHTLITLVIMGTLPIFILFFQFLLVGLFGLRNHYSKCEDYLPNVAVIIPAWNEGDVIGETLDRLLNLDYPSGSLKIYAVDDGSTDNTPIIIQSRAAKFPQQVTHVRLEKGGLGKANTLNNGLKVALADDWAEAVLIIDADILFESDALRKMTRHFADPEVGAITSYIKVAQTPGNLITHSIGAEYIVSQAAARRAQNVLGVLACLAGGSQLHTRANIDALGGKIDTSTLAEDTFTTFSTQLQNRHVLFEPHAVASAEEPEDLLSLWKQRFRWARGNIQISFAFSRLWFRPSVTKLGGLFFGLIWFSVLLMPFCMITASVCLIILFFIDFQSSWIAHPLFSGQEAMQ